MCRFIRKPPDSQVVKQYRNGSGKNENERSENGGERPVMPRNVERRLVQLSQHVRPEIAAEFGVRDRREKLFEEFFQLFVVLFVHLFVPNGAYKEPSFLRSMRTARKTRIL